MKGYYDVEVTMTLKKNFKGIKADTEQEAETLAKIKMLELFDCRLANSLKLDTQIIDLNKSSW